MENEKSYRVIRIASLKQNGSVQKDTEKVSELISGNYKPYGPPFVLGNEVFQSVLKYRG